MSNGSCKNCRYFLAVDNLLKIVHKALYNQWLSECHEVDDFEMPWGGVDDDDVGQTFCLLTSQIDDKVIVSTWWKYVSPFLQK